MPVLRLFRNARIPAPHAIAACGRALAALLFFAPSSSAQDVSGQEPPPHIAVVDGDVTLQRELETDTADPGMPVVPGDRIRTARGRAAILLPDGSALDVDEFTTLDVQSPSLVSLSEGRIRLTVPRDSRARLDVATPAGTARIEDPGEYRVAVLGTTYTQTELAVVRGVATLDGQRDSIQMTAGERSVVWTDDEPAPAERFNVARLDAFDRWSAEQRDGRTAGYSARYLPSDLRPYGGEFDRNGAWQYDSAYGYVWYPTVDTAWRPYFSGYWTSLPAYGWTWIGLERWAWPTHHYGRWGHARDRWFWIPDRRWAAAWVSWGSAPGYVGWSPLGWDNRPVFQWSLSTGYGSNGWVVLPTSRFGVRREYVHRAAVAPRTLPPRTPFVARSTPPPTPSGRAVPRGSIARGRDAGRPEPPPIGGGRARDGVAAPRVGAAPPSDAKRSRPGRPAIPRDGSAGRGAVRPPDAQPRNPRDGFGTSLQPPAPADPAGASGPRAAFGSGANRAEPRGRATEQSRQPRFYPFRDFRERTAPATSGTPDLSSVTTGTPESTPGAAERGQESGQAPPSRRPPARVYAPPPSGTSSERSPRTESSGGGSIRENPGGGGGGRQAPPRGGIRGSDGSGGGMAQPRSGAPQPGGGAGRRGDAAGAPRGDGRAHDPGSRRPR